MGTLPSPTFVPRARGGAAWVRFFALGGAGAAGVSMAAIVGFLVIGASSGPVDWTDVVGSGVWDPGRGRFGGAAMIWGTSVVAGVALAIAAPIGWVAAIAINEVVPCRLRRSLRSCVELLAVVPSIVYGLIGVAFLRPFVASVFGVPGGDSLLTASLVLAVMVLPTVVAVSIDALGAVSRDIREASAALGLTQSETIWSTVVPAARRGLRAAALLGLARAIGETVAVYLVVGRADFRMPGAIGDLVRLLTSPGQTLTTKLNSPESVLAGTSGAHWASLCALGLVLVGGVLLLTVAGQRRAEGADAAPWNERRALRAPAPGRSRRDRAFRASMLLVVTVPLGALAGIAIVLAVKGHRALDPAFWWTAAVGAGGGGIRDQLAGTVLLVAVAAMLAAPIGLALGLVMAEYCSVAACRWLSGLTLSLAGIPSIVLGLWGYWLLSSQLGWGKSWLAGSIVLAVIAVPPVAVATVAAAGTVPAERREAAAAIGLRHDQIVRSVVVPQAVPGLVTGLLLGLARAAGETAPLLFTATVFSGAPPFPSAIRHEPVSALPTHIFELAQDALERSAVETAWGAALALVVVAGLLVVAAIPARRWSERRAR